MPSPDTNPYASPQVGIATEQDPRQKILNQLRGPSLGLILLSILFIIISLVGALGTAVEWIVNGQRFRVGWEEILQGILLLPGAYIAYGAWCMRRTVNYRVALLAAIMACIPVVSPWIFLGIPFGIWALVVLCRRDVRAAFDSPR